jgi:hypothetical protein
VTYSVGVRSFFGATKSQKKSVTPKIRKFRQSWGSKRYAIQYETESHAPLLTGTGDFVKIPKIGAIHKKNATTKFTQSRYFYERGRVASKRKLIALPKKV